MVTEGQIGSKQWRFGRNQTHSQQILFRVQVNVQYGCDTTAACQHERWHGRCVVHHDGRVDYQHVIALPISSIRHRSGKPCQPSSDHYSQK